MGLKNEILEKIKELFEVSGKITKYWVNVQLYHSGEYNTFDLKISVYTFVDERNASLFVKEINLNETTAEQQLQYAIDNIKELITPSSNEND